MQRTATAVWKGSGKEGKGHLNTQSNVLSQTQYSYKTRFEEGTGTNPEELIAAAHAGCFTMKLSFLLNEAGFTAEELTTTAAVSLNNGAIDESKLTLKASIPGIEEEKFQELAKNAKENCPVSKLLNAKISLEATLLS